MLAEGELWSVFRIWKQKSEGYVGGTLHMCFTSMISMRLTDANWVSYFATYSKLRRRIEIHPETARECPLLKDQVSRLMERAE